jgi:hypothetical protein
VSAHRNFSRFALAAVLLGFGCNQPAGGGKTKDDKVSTTACADYAKKVCDETGAESGTCTSVKATTDLMPAAACAIALSDFEHTKK